MTGARGRRLLAGLLAVAAALHAASVLGTPVGGIVDDAVYLLLARALRSGAYVLPDGLARPVTSYWPGAPVLWALPAWLCGGSWGWCRLGALAVAWAALWQVWRLARGLLRAESAAAVVILAAFCPVFAANAGVCGSDTAFLALSAAAFAALPKVRRASVRADDRLLLACAAAAALFRPEGFLLIGALALAVFAASDVRRAVRFSAFAALPALFWLARNRLLAGTASDYGRQFASQAAALADPLALIDQVLRLIGLLFGRGLLGITWDPLALAAGFLVLAAAGIGAFSALRRRQDPRALALAAFVAAVLVLHVLWRQVLDRYLLLVLAPTLALAALAAEEFLSRSRAAALASVVLALALIGDARALNELKMGAEPWPATLAYVRDRLPPDALIQSPAAPVVMLWTGHRAISTFEGVGRDQWLAKCLNNHVEYLILDENLAHWSRMPGPWLATIASLNRWAETSPYVKLELQDIREMTAIYRVAHPDPARYLRAWDDFRAAMTQSPDADAARARLKEALALEPELASARLALAGLESEPAASEDRRKALASDPTLTPAN